MVVAGGQAAEAPLKKKKLGKKEREAAKKRAQAGEDGAAAADGPAPPKKRYTLFVGNLPYDVSCHPSRNHLHMSQLQDTCFFAVSTRHCPLRGPTFAALQAFPAQLTSQPCLCGDVADPRTCVADNQRRAPRILWTLHQEPGRSLAQKRSMNREMDC
eukprot:3302021-Rhodomonas_salina.1